MKHTRLAAALILGAIVLSGCSHGQAARRRELSDISERHAQELSAFERAQAAFARTHPMPRRLDFPGAGTILLHECALQGRPARAELWLRYTYVNTTNRPIDAVLVTITIDDPAGEDGTGVEMPLELPLGFRFSPDSSYTTSIAVPTEGLHLDPGWSWSICPAPAPRSGQ